MYFKVVPLEPYSSIRQYAEHTHHTCKQSYVYCWKHCMKIASRLIHQKIHVSLKISISVHTGIFPFSQPPEFFSLTIYFKYLISTEKKPCWFLAPCSSCLYFPLMLTSFFLSLKCPGLLHYMHFCLYMPSTTTVLKHWFLGYCLITISKTLRPKVSSVLSLHRPTENCIQVNGTSQIADSQCHHCKPCAELRLDSRSSLFPSL